MNLTAVIFNLSTVKLGSKTFGNYERFNAINEANFTEINTSEDLLKLASEFEKDRVIFYNMLRPFIEDKDTLDFFKKIIDEENHHIRELNVLADCNTEARKIIS